ncbi:unnamed protein product [Linum trigynum]|uniref:Uncharacterized protein n=1 Tax=Linum trigynum TaxID=586398 RepID=A0AAV2FWP2_9ROSI
MQLPATTLTMCPSCQCVATTNTSTAFAAPASTSPSPITTVTAVATDDTNNSLTTLSFSKLGGGGERNGSNSIVCISSTTIATASTYPTSRVMTQKGRLQLLRNHRKWLAIITMNSMK